MNAFFRKYSPTKLLAVSSLLSLGLIAVLSGFIHLNVNKTNSVQTAFSTKINLSGYQRMLSQRSAFYTTAFVQFGKLEDKNVAQNSVELLKKRHQQLLYSLNHPINGLTRPIRSERLNSLFFDLPNDLDNQLRQYIDMIESILENPEGVEDRELENLKIASQSILERLDKVVKQYEVESQEEIRNLRSLQLITLLTIGGLFLIQVFVVINPLLKMAEKLSSRLLDEANIDPLTNLYNRRFLDAVSEQVIADYKRYEKPLSLVYMDIDDLKIINDSHGHAVGDEAIKLVANTIRSVSRKSDKAFRIGGEEFLLLLPNTNAHGAFTLVEKIRKGVEAQSKLDMIETVRFTVSSGVSEILASEDSINAGLKRADDALYQAKREKKNKTVVA
ncbi:MAG: GGDEF domain-containing protein [Pseudomonadota bacterium]